MTCPRVTTVRVSVRRRPPTGQLALSAPQMNWTVVHERSRGDRAGEARAERIGRRLVAR